MRVGGKRKDHRGQGYDENVTRFKEWRDWTMYNDPVTARYIVCTLEVNTVVNLKSVLYQSQVITEYSLS